MSETQQFYDLDQHEIETPEEFEEPDGLRREGQRNFRCQAVEPTTYVTIGTRSDSYEATVQINEKGGDSTYEGFESVEEAVEQAEEYMDQIAQEA